MKNLLSLILITLLFACSQKDPNKKVEITGDLSNSNEETIYLEELTPSAINIIDSAVVNKNGQFSMNIQVPEIGYYKLRIANNNFVVLVLDTIENLKIKADASKLSKTYSVEGSENSKSLWELNELRNKVIAVQDSMQTIFQQNQNNPRIDSIGATLQAYYLNVITGFQNQVKSFVEKYHDSFVALSATENLNPDTDLDLFLKVEKSLTTKYPNSAYVKLLSRRVKDLTKLSVGSAAPEISLSNTEGNPFNLSSLKGKVVLVDFWASWCKPCRNENPNVVKMYAKFKSKGFDILGVSLDRAKEPWIKAIQDDKLAWNQVWDQNNIASSAYGVTGIPFTVLLDKEGNIIAKGLRGEELENKLSEILK